MNSRPGLEVVAEGFALLEAPRWHGGHLYVSDMYGGHIYRVAGNTVETICAVPGRPSGLGFTPSGQLLAVSMTDRRLLRLVGDVLEDFADLSAAAPADTNDMVVDRAGRAYVGNFGSDIEDGSALRPTVLLRVDPDGKVAIAADELLFPNGSVISEDGRTLVVSETFAFRLTAFDIDSDGALSGRREWARFADDPVATIPEALGRDVLLPDGLAIDVEGAIWVANAKGNGIQRVAEGGHVLESIDTGDLAVYAAALGGEDRRTLYLCAAPPFGAGDPMVDRHSKLLQCAVQVPGAGIP